MLFTLAKMLLKCLISHFTCVNNAGDFIGRDYDYSASKVSIVGKEKVGQRKVYFFHIFS